MTDSKKTTLVLFSGGRDSSATAVAMAHAGFYVKLFTYQGGLPELTGPKGDSAPDIRHLELLKAFPSKVDPDRVITGNTYLIRKLGIEKTNETHVVYPIAIMLMVQASAIIYSLENDFRDIACGFSGYQAKKDRYVEQRKDFLDLIKKFTGEYGITLHAPVIDKSKEEVIDLLERFGISSNSLENKALYGGIAFDVDKALDFWNKSLPICREYIDFMRPQNA